VVVTVNDGRTSQAYTFLPPVDPDGNVPFPYGRPEPGTTVFTVQAGGVTVTFEATFR
jgi:hypothetical protein